METDNEKLATQPVADYEHNPEAWHELLAWADEGRAHE